METSFWHNLTNLFKPPRNEPTMSDFAGDWFSTFGPMTLNQNGEHVQGTYHPGPEVCTLDGTILDGVLRFRYQEPNAVGEGWFALQRHGKFVGKWRQDGQPAWQPWQGERGFEGLWNSTFGPLRLIQGETEVHGYYEGLGSSTILGQLDGKQLTFRYKEPQAQGDGIFQLSDDGFNFEGQWRPDGAPGYSPWVGQRILPKPGLVWLVVLEAYWQRGLGDKEYAFGNMLREFFARVPRVEVRQRFFNNEAGLAKWCRELLFLAEPIALVLATHGTPEGLTAHGELIRAEPIAEILRQADNIQVLHFSSCLLMDQGPAGEFARVLRQTLRFPISGYTTSVDWAASALIEFTYIDMILARGLDPHAAAKQVTRLIAFAGNEGPEDSPYPPAHFVFWQPDRVKGGAPSPG